MPTTEATAFNCPALGGGVSICSDRNIKFGESERLGWVLESLTRSLIRVYNTRHREVSQVWEEGRPHKYMGRVLACSPQEVFTQDTPICFPTYTYPSHF